MPLQGPFPRSFHLLGAAPEAAGAPKTSPHAQGAWLSTHSVTRGSFACTFSEDRVIEHYKKLNGQTRGQAIVK